MPTPTGRAQPGDIYGIPLDAASYAVVKVVYASRYFRNVIGIGVAPALESGSDLARGKALQFNKAVLYSAQACAKTEWVFLRSEPVTTEEAGYSLRLVGGHVYLGDTLLRSEGPEDRRNLRNMAVSGCGAVVNILRDLFSPKPSHPSRWLPPTLPPA